MDLAWLWPLIAGAVLTGGAGFVERASVRRQEFRRESRTHIGTAFAAATGLSRAIHDARSENRFADDPIEAEELPSLRKLIELVERLPGRRLRASVRDACFVISVATWAHQIDAWATPAGNTQEAAANRLCRVLGAAERGDVFLPRGDVRWLHEHQKAAETAIDSAINS